MPQNTKIAKVLQMWNLHRRLLEPIVPYSYCALQIHVAFNLTVYLIDWSAVCQPCKVIIGLNTLTVEIEAHTASVVRRHSFYTALHSKFSISSHNRSSCIDAITFNKHLLVDGPFEVSSCLKCVK